MRDSISNPDAVYWYWHPEDKCWYDVVRCGDLSIRGWVKLLRETGYCTCSVKRNRKWD